MIGRFLGFATDAASNVLNLFGRSDIQQASVERTAAYFGAVDEAADEVMEPVDLGPLWPIRPGRWTIKNIDGTDYWVTDTTTDELLLGRGQQTSAASNPPGASDAGPEQVPPTPASGLPDPLPVCEAGSEGSGVDSDIPQSATPEQPRWMLISDRHGEEYRMELANGIIVRATVEEMIDYPYFVEQRVKAAERCEVAARFSMPTTPATPDLNGDPEIELALLRCEVNAALRRLGRYREMYGPLPE